MGSGCDQVSMVERGWNSPCCHQAADMSHICQQVGLQLHTQLQLTQSETVSDQPSVGNASLDTHIPCFLLLMFYVPSSCECSRWGERRRWFLRWSVWAWRAGPSSPAAHNLWDLFWAEIIKTLAAREVFFSPTDLLWWIWYKSLFVVTKSQIMTHVQLVRHRLKVDGGGRDPLSICHVAMGEAEMFQNGHYLSSACSAEGSCEVFFSTECELALTCRAPGFSSISPGCLHHQI